MLCYSAPSLKVRMADIKMAGDLAGIVGGVNMIKIYYMHV